MVIADYDGERYLVSMLGSRANWVRNLEADGGRAELHHGKREAVTLVEIEPALRAPVIRRYLTLAPGARPDIPVDRTAPLTGVRAHRGRLPRVPDRPRTGADLEAVPPAT